MNNCEVKVKRSDKEELFHSDTFLGDEFSDEMYHWKYIKKKKVNGKWRYYYDNSELDKFARGDSVVNSKDNTIDTKIYRQSDRLFDKKSTGNGSINMTGAKTVNLNTTIHEQGKLSRSYAKAEKKIFDTFYSGKRKNTKVHALKGAVNRGKNALRKFLGIH